jgi:hypothetical protein
LTDEGIDSILVTDERDCLSPHAERLPRLDSIREPFIKPLRRFTYMLSATAVSLSPLTRAFSRAVAEKIVVTHTSDARVLAVASVTGGIWSAKPYHITVTGPQPEDVTCDCPAGSHGRTCKHLAVAIFAREHHVYAQRPTARLERLISAPSCRCDVCGTERADPMHEVFCQG